MISTADASLPVADETARPEDAREWGATDNVIIIGGGLVGLTLAWKLRKLGIPATVYERDSKPDSKERGGWAITIHWALDALKNCLPKSLFDVLWNIQVDVDQASEDKGKFMFLDMESLEPKYQIPPSKRMRLNRALFRHMLTIGLNIKWRKRLVGLDATGKGKVTVHFDDGTSTSGSIVVGCDGARSQVRQLLFADNPSEAKLNILPVRALGVTIRMTKNHILPLLQVDPLLFQGCHPDTGVFLWYSTVSTPVLNHSLETDDPYFEGQLMISWLHKDKSDSIPDGNRQRLLKMRELTSNFEPRLRTAIANIPLDTQVQAITLADWPTRRWPNHDGRVTLAGDAAHAMTMYRGEAYNHGVFDAILLGTQLYRTWTGESSLQDLIDQYEEEVCQRTRDAVLLSRQACLDAHDLHNLKSDSPVVSRRARITAPSTES